MADKLTQQDVIALAAVLLTAGKKVAYLVGGNAHYGHARHVVVSADNYGFPSADADIREAYLRITTQSGFEVAYPVAALAESSKHGEYMAYDW